MTHSYQYSDTVVIVTRSVFSTAVLLASVAISRQPTKLENSEKYRASFDSIRTVTLGLLFSTCFMIEVPLSHHNFELWKKQIKLKSEFPFAAAFLLAGFSVFLLFQGVFMAREEKREEQKNTGPTVQDKPGPDVELSQTSPVSENTDKTPSVSVSVEQGESKSSEIQQDIKGMETGMQSSTFEVEVPFENRPSDAQQTTAGPDVSGMSQVWDTPVASKHSKRVTTALFVGLCVSAFVHGGSFNFRGANPVDLSIRLAAHLGLRCLLSLVLSHFCLVEGVGLFASRTYILFHAAAMPAGILMNCLVDFQKDRLLSGCYFGFAAGVLMYASLFTCLSGTFQRKMEPWKEYTYYLFGTVLGGLVYFGCR